MSSKSRFTVRGLKFESKIFPLKSPHMPAMLSPTVGFRQIPFDGAHNI
jgi:hypothetical protein